MIAYEGHGVTVHHGDCLEVLAGLPDCSVDAVVFVTPPGGLVLDPFAGSGTTVEACMLEGVRCVAVEREDTYLPLIVARIQRADAALLF